MSARRVRTNRHAPIIDVLISLLAAITLVGCVGVPGLGLGPTPTPEPPLARYDRAIATAEAGGDRTAQAAAYSTRGDFHIDSGAYEQAIADYTRAIDLEPDNARNFNNRALAYQGLGQSDAALADFLTATGIDPEYVRAFKNRAALLEQVGGDPHRLAADYGALAELEPTEAGVYRYRQGTVLHQLRDFPGARTAYDAALAADPQQVDALYERALLNYAEGRLPDAIADLDRAIELSPRAANAYYARGLALNTAGDRTSALADLSQALALDPAYAEALLARAALRHATGDRAGAIADLDRLNQLTISGDLQAAATALRRELGI